MKPFLVLGIGNVLKGDDGAGPAVVRFLEERAGMLGPDVEILDGGTGGQSLLPVMRGRRKIVIIDAIVSSEDAGQVRCLRPDDLREPERPFSLHAAGVSGLAQSLRLLGERPDMEIIAVSVKGVESTKIGLSHEVQRAVPAAAEAAARAISNQEAPCR